MGADRDPEEAAGRPAADEDRGSGGANDGDGDGGSRGHGAPGGSGGPRAEGRRRRQVTPGLLGSPDPSGTTPETIESLPLPTIPGYPAGPPPASSGPSGPSGPQAGEDWPTGGYYTPAAGIPVGSLRRGAPGAAPWPDRMRTLLRTPMSERPAYERSRPPLGAAARPVGDTGGASGGTPLAVGGAAGTPPSGIPQVTAERTAVLPAAGEHAAGYAPGPSAPRVLDLTLRIGELLLASGESAEDVEAAMLGVTHAYGLDRCEPTVTFTLLSISYQPSLIDPSITADRVVRRRGTDYTRLAAVYRLVGDITLERCTVEEAYRRLAGIRRNRHPYPGWLITLAGGGLAGAASLLVGGRLDGAALLVFVSAFVAAVLGDRLAWLLASRGLPEFYQFTVAAMPAAAMGVLLTAAGTGLRGSVVITGGLFALLPGRALVAAVADGLTGFYITASARLLEVVYLVVGIVAGVLLVLYAGVTLHTRLHPEEGLLKHNDPGLQLVAAAGLTLFFAVMLQTDRSRLLLVTLNGAVGWTVFGTLTTQAGTSPILATGLAAGLVGLFGQLASRYQYASALPYVTAAIGPLLPGSALYLGMLGLAQGDPQQGLVYLSTAAATALSLAVGVNLGGEIARLFMHIPVIEGGAPRRAAKRTRGF